MKDPIDITVGQTVRELRIRKSLSQQVLGDRCGVSFQQIQKYERGTNGMRASRLVQIARILDVPIESLFVNINTPNATPFQHSERTPLSIAATKVARDWAKISDPTIRQHLATMMRSITLEQARLERQEHPQDGLTGLSGTAQQASHKAAAE